MAKDDSKCRHELLCEAYLSPNKKYYHLMTGEKSCDCKSDMCPRRHEYFKTENEDSASNSEDEMTRFVSEKEKQLIHDKLVFYKCP